MLIDKDEAIRLVEDELDRAIDNVNISFAQGIRFGLERALHVIEHRVPADIELLKRCHPIIDVSSSTGTIGLTRDEIKAILNGEENSEDVPNDWREYGCI